MDGLTATIVGGTSFTGGIGTPWGTVIGAFVVGFLGNVMNLMSIDSYIQQIVKGAIIASQLSGILLQNLVRHTKKENNLFLKEHFIKKKII